MTTREDLILRGIRKERLLRQLRELEQLINGSTVSFRALFAGEDGLPDLGRLEQTVGELTRNYELFRKPAGIPNAIGEEDVTRDLEREESLMTGQDRRMVETFFYCMLRLLADSPWFDGTVGELLLYARLAENSRPGDVLEDEIYLDDENAVFTAARERKDFFLVCDAAFEKLGRENILRTVPENIRAMFAAGRKPGPSERVWVVTPRPDDEERDAAELSVWSDRFAQLQRFCGAYLSFRKNWFAQGHFPEDFAETVRSAVGLWLSENRLNHFSDDAVYFSMQNLLTQALDRAARLIAEETAAPRRRTRKLPGGGVL